MNSQTGFLQTIRRWYPQAVTTQDATDRFLDTANEKLGLQPQQLMHADSICCDDVNAIQYPERAREMLGPFNMGGLNGFPFAGLTGMNAFAHHVPEDGAVFVFYGPHIGISKAGVLGEVQRYGQRAPSACCGAAKGALGKLQNNAIVEGEITELDYQMNRIEQIFYRQKERILSASLPIFEATEVMYEAIDNRVQELVEKTDYPCRYVLLMGGILINSDADVGSFVCLRRFDCIELESDERRSFLQMLLEGGVSPSSA